MAGICRTDLELMKGYYPFAGVPGHEFVGEIVSAPGAPEREGERVVGEINVACGHCHLCNEGLQNHCSERTVVGILGRDGAFADYLSLPLENLHFIPDSIPDQVGIFVEPLAAALQIPCQAHISPSDRVLLVGAGKLGQLVARVLSLIGCDVKVVARHEDQKALISASGEISLVSEDRCPRNQFDIVVEASGSPGGLQLARRAVRPRGQIILKSTYKGKTSIDWSSLVVDEITLTGSRCGPFPPAIKLLEQGIVDPSPLICEIFPLQAGLDAFAEASRPAALKVALRM
jgi:2-desacetyl-2-hydroxyethyl bacteriochlorophyllide A dehydrogenase